MREEKIAQVSRYLLYFILAVLPLERIPSLELAHPIQMTVRLSQVAGLVLILVNLPLTWRSRGQLLRWPWRWLVAFLGVGGLSAAMAMDLKRAVSVMVFTAFVGVLAWVVALRFERERMGTYVKIVVWSGLIACLFGFYQFFGDLLGLPPVVTGLRDVYTKDTFGFPRIQSTALEPLYFGNFLLLPAGMLIVAIVTGWRRRWAMWAFMLIATVVWLTVSRGAMVALGLMIAVGLVVAGWRRQWGHGARLVGAVIISVGLALGLLYMGTHVVTKAKTDQTAHAIENFSKQTTNISNGESSEGRAVTRRLATRAFMAHPLLGIGPGNFGLYAALQMPERFAGGQAIVNNEPLEVLAETGLVGLVSLLLFLGGVVWLAVRATVRKRDSAEQRVVAWGLSLALLGIGLQYQTFSTLYITHLWVAVGLLAGLVTAGGLNRAKRSV